MPLVPEIRTDRNGRAQRRWVRASGAAAPGRTPPPAAPAASGAAEDEPPLGWEIDLPDYVPDTIRELPASLALAAIDLCRSDDSRSGWLRHGVGRILVNPQMDAAERGACLEVLMAHHDSARRCEGSEPQALAVLFGLRAIERDLTGPLGWAQGDAALAVLCAHHNGSRTGGWRVAGALHGMMAITPSPKAADLIGIAVRHPHEAARIVGLSDAGLSSTQIAAVLDDGGALSLAGGAL